MTAKITAHGKQTVANMLSVFK